MGNHFHLLLRIDHDAPNPLESASDREFLDHLDLIYSTETVQRIGWQLESFRAGGLDREASALRAKFLARMRDVPSFMRELKQRFTQWHNRREGRKGPLWEDRYKSVLVEDSETAVRTMAAYIDLNPLRAGTGISRRRTTASRLRPPDIHLHIHFPPGPKSSSDPGPVLNARAHDGNPPPLGRFVELIFKRS